MEKTVTSVLVVKARAQHTPEGETVESLSKLTKHEIYELALERFGIELNVRSKKDQMITEFLEEQK